jgi:LPS-assembly protein
MNFHVLFVSWLYLLSFVGPSAHAQIIQGKEKTKVLLNAQFIERDNEKNITILRDNVQVIFEENFISCNEAVILWAKNEIVAVGNVLLKTIKSDIKADKIIFNFNDQTGKIFNGIIISGQVLMQGDVIDKTGPETYNANNAYFTSCTTCPASWSLTADNVDATVEGYAYLKNPLLHFAEVPFIYMPYLVIPLKNERQTGLLPPSFQTSTYSGAGIELPFFWAINRSQDMTVTAGYLEKSGLQTSVNYRYRLSQKSSGELTSYYLRDKAYSPSYDARWFTTYAHYLELPNNYIQRTSLHAVSDTNYSTDFIHFPFRGESALDNRTSITKNFPYYHLSIDSSFYTSLIQENIDAGKETSVHRIPEIRFSLADQKLSESANIFLQFNAQYVNFSRQSLGYDSPYAVTTSKVGYRPQSPLGNFNPDTDIVRTGQRLDIQPMLYSPQRILNNPVDVTPYLGYRHTQYVLGAVNETANYDFFTNRNYVITGLRTSTELSAIYRSADTRYRHSIAPSLDFQSIPFFHQPDHTFFGSQDQIPYFLQTQPLQDADLLTGGRGLQFDYEDRIVGRRLANLGISNRITKKNHTGLGLQYEQPFLFTLTQAYDFIEAKKDDGRPWQDIRALMKIQWGMVDSLTEVFSFPYHKVTNVSSRVRFNFATNFFEFIYSNYLNVPALPSQVNLNDRQETLWLSSGLVSTYFSLSGQAEFSLIDKEKPWKQWRLQTEITPPGHCWNISANLSKTLDVDNFVWTAMVNFRFGK